MAEPDEIQALVDEFNRVEAEQMQRLLRLYPMLKQAGGQGVRFGCGLMWGRSFLRSFQIAPKMSDQVKNIFHALDRTITFE